MLFCSFAFAQVQGETPALTPLTSELGTHLIAMPTYTYSRMPGTLGLRAEEETWHPDKWRNRQIFHRFIPIMDWELKQKESGIWFYTGNEIGDELWQEIIGRNDEQNRTPMLYGGFVAKPVNGFYAMAQFNQVDHFSEATFNARRDRINSQKFALASENLPAYSGVFGGLGYNNELRGERSLFKNASVLAGSEYLWAWNENEWMPIQISPRVEANASLYFMEHEIELHAATEKFQIKDSATENRSDIGLRMRGKNTGGGFYVTEAKGGENITIWTDFNHSLFGFANRGFIAVDAWPNQEIKREDIHFADSLEYGINMSNSTDLTLGVLVNQNGAKLYGETAYESKPLSAKSRAYQNYTADFQSIGLDGEVAYKSALAEAGVAYSREFFEYYREHIFYNIKPAETSAKIFLKYSFLRNLIFAHELVYRSEIRSDVDIPATWFWNAQIEQKIPKLNTSLYAVWLHALSKDNKDFSFGGVNRTRFYCGLNTWF
ncbi:MAG: hypothetical protein FWH22_05715 [Fibromonadales bacterium]|nr:hypothetical protein [Fibromonadales bacterium]